jgi:hypothetical protein
MKSPLYIFNPEHDLALANDDPNFNPPMSALQFVCDLEYLPLWYAEPGSFVLGRAGCNSEWLKKLQLKFPQIADISFKSDVNIDEISDIRPWGWDKLIKKQILIYNEDVLTKLLPDEIQLADIKRLSHRRTAISALEFLRLNISTDLFPLPPTELKEISQVKSFASKNPSVIFKAPWSGSGKGLRWVRNQMTESHRGWCKNIIDKQGSIIAEHIYNVVQNFAMLFVCTNGQCSFAGYSLFETEKGIYRSNSLLSNEEIFNRLAGIFVHPELLLTVRDNLLGFIEKNIAQHYSGMLGIDMFVYNEDGELKLHPCVEINLRMTMGCVARIFYDRFVHHSSTGQFYVDHFPTKHQLWEDHVKRETALPLKIEKGKIKTGYLPLSFVDANSHYRLRVEI